MASRWRINATYNPLDVIDPNFQFHPHLFLEELKLPITLPSATNIKLGSFDTDGHELNVTWNQTNTISAARFLVDIPKLDLKL